MYEFPHPETRVTESKLGGKWIVDGPGWSANALAFARYDDALAEAYARTARDLRRQADVCERVARDRSRDPELLTPS